MRRPWLSAFLGGAGAAGLVIAGLAGSSVAAGAKAPDLVVIGAGFNGLGTHPFAVLKADGTIDTVVVDVTTENRGNATARSQSETQVEFDLGGSRRVVESAKIRAPLIPGQKVESTLTFKDLRPELGFTTVTATADAGNAVKESTSGEANNKTQLLKFPVEARFWDVRNFIIEADPPGITRETLAKPRLGGRGFRFTFSHYDNAAEQFVYTAGGPVKDIAGTYGSCTSPDTKTVTHDPWPDSFLKIDGDLRHYNAVVTTHAENYMANYTCRPAGGFSTETPFNDLVTFHHRTFPPMSPSDPTLENNGAPGPESTTYTWKFAAVIP